MPVRNMEATIVMMHNRPRDTSETSWVAQRDVVARMAPVSRMLAAIDLSDSVREIQIQGLLARNPTWVRSEAVQWLIERLGSRTQL